jgi:membrane protein
MTTHSSVAKARTAPAPDAPRKPNTPPQLKKPSWKYILKNTGREFLWDHCTDIAASLTYYAVLSLFPALLAVVALLGVFGQAQKTTNALLSTVQQVAPGQAVTLLRGPIHQLVTSPSAGLALVVGILGALWSASAYVRAFSRGMNRVYEVDEGRPMWKLLPTTLFVTIVGVIIIALMAVVVALSGGVAKTVGNAVGLGDAAVAVWSIVKWPVLAILAIIALALLYYFTPNVRQPKFRWMSLGALVALVIAALASVGFAFYVTNFSHYNKTYGAIGSFIILLLWIWIVNLALVFGAEFDSETERARELQAGIKAEKTLQLPPRDDRKSRKRSEQEEQVVAEGRALRERFNGGAGGPA